MPKGVRARIPHPLPQLKYFDIGVIIIAKNSDNHIGDIVGIFTILYKCDYKSTDGHELYHIKCNECGWETDRQLRHIQHTTQCKHCCYIDGEKFYYQNQEWHNKTLRHIFTGIITRCYNPNDKSYRWYGAKGIKVCHEWLQDRLSFEDWALNNGYQDGLTIDRIDEDKDYCPENCRWVTLANNAKYKSTTTLLEVDGVIHTGREWSELLNFGINTVNKLLRENPTDKVKELIKKRLQDKTLTRRSHQTWFKAYGIE